MLWLSQLSTCRIKVEVHNMVCAFQQLWKSVLVLVMAAALGLSPSAGWGFPELPEPFRPAEVPPRWNSNSPPLMDSPEEAVRARTVAPQWVRNFFSFPSPQEISDHLGQQYDIQQARAAQSIRQVLAPRLVPDGLETHLIPMARWGQLYEDWRRYGGLDLFLTKFTVGTTTFLITESATHVIIVARDSSLAAATNRDDLSRYVFSFATNILGAATVPESAKDLRTLRSGTSPRFLTGHYLPRLLKLTGMDDQNTTITDQAESANVQSVRFFTNGQMVAFKILKPVDDPTELENPFEPRFEPMRARAGDMESRAVALAGSLRTSDSGRQLEEYLGFLLTTEEQGKFLAKVPLEEVEKRFLALEREQKIAMVRQKMVEEYLRAGMRSFLLGRYEDAIQYWLRNIELDLENPRVAYLLRIAVDKQVESKHGGDRNRAQADPPIFQAERFLQRHQQTLRKRQETLDIQAARERSIIDHRTRALQAMSEGNLRESFDQWSRILELDPGNPNAQVFRELVRSRMKTPAPLRGMPIVAPNSSPEVP